MLSYKVKFIFSKLKLQLVDKIILVAQIKMVKPSSTMLHYDTKPNLYKTKSISYIITLNGNRNLINLQILNVICNIQMLRSLDLKCNVKHKVDTIS